MKVQQNLFESHPDWPAVLHIHRVLKSKGHKVLVAGGAVRDALLGRVPKDFDIATDAEPQEVESYFERTIGVGKQFGVIIVNEGDRGFEVATFRMDGKYVDGRHPEDVIFSSPEEDAKRRDFTVNALFYDIDSGKILDFVGGEQDVAKRFIRAVGNPLARFEEDKLRMLRAIRFAAQLDFHIEEDTWKSILVRRHEIEQVSAERISEELRKLLLSAHPVKGFFLLKESQILPAIWPSLTLINSKFYLDMLYRGFDLLKGKSSFELLLALLLVLEVQFEIEHVGMNWRVGADRQLKELGRFRFPRETMRILSFLLRVFPDMQKLNTDSLILLSDDHGLLLLELLKTYRVLMENPPEALDEFLERYVALSGPDGRLHPAFLKGEDLENLRIPKGPVYGDLLKEGYRLQLENKIKTRAAALQWLKERSAKI